MARTLRAACVPRDIRDPTARHSASVYHPQAKPFPCMPFDTIQAARRMRYPSRQGLHATAPDLLRLMMAQRPGYRGQARLEVVGGS
eukprot:4493019-Pyramimonas_sp.AAC.1